MKRGGNNGHSKIILPGDKDPSDEEEENKAFGAGTDNETDLSGGVMVTYKAKTWMNNRQVVSAVKQASLPRLKQAAFLIEADAKLSMKSGGRTIGPMGGAVGTPSPPDSPPHVQTGNLRASIQTAITRVMTYVIGPTLQAWYGRTLEFGRMTMMGFIKHPFMRPALERVKGRMPYLFKNLKLARTPSGQILNRAKGPL